MFHQGEGVQVEDVHRDDQRCDVGDGDDSEDDDDDCACHAREERI